MVCKWYVCYLLAGGGGGGGGWVIKGISKIFHVRQMLISAKNRFTCRQAQSESIKVGQTIYTLN